MDEQFARASQIWDLDKLYADLAFVKRENLTPTQKIHLRGLLLGLSPREIAQELGIGVAGLRVALCSLYRYVEALLDLPEGDVNFRVVSHLLKQAGYSLGDIDSAIEPALLPLAPLNSPPLPEAEIELPWGQVDRVSKFYVNRPSIESSCFETILKPGALIRIKAPRQMGKTSLLSRILYHAEQQQYLTVPLSLQLAERETLSNLENFLRWFCANVSLALQLPIRLNDYWDDIFGSKINSKLYFEQYLLPTIEPPVVLGLDEVDRLFQYPTIAEDFFGLLRAWHESSKNDDIWKKLRLVVVHSTEVYVPLENNQSPFNVGLPINLPEFTPSQVEDLAQRHGLGWTPTEVDQLMALIGGHPYLVRVALYYIAKEDIPLKELLQQAPTESGPYGDHLRRHLLVLEQHPELAVAITQLLEDNEPMRLESIPGFQLSSMGLVKLQGNQATLRCELYRQYFRDRLLR